MLAARMLGSSTQAEDAVQDALASVWIARSRLDPLRPIGPFLTTTVLNKCRDHLRRRKVARFVGLGPSLDELTVADESPGPEALAVSRDTLARLRNEIERLPIRLREALVLVAIDDRSQLEAADLLGVTEKAIETRVYRARKRLREKIDQF
jgi:RNA polymerase sigma factor (sigma-70 family)